jgi:hypothetical protein
MDITNISSFSTCLTMTREGLFVAISENGIINVYNLNVDHQYNLNVESQYTFPLLNDRFTDTNIYIHKPILSKQLSTTGIYKGFAITNNILYLADFLNSCIDTYDEHYNKLVGKIACHAINLARKRCKSCEKITTSLLLFLGRPPRKYKINFCIFVGPNSSLATKS